MAELDVLLTHDFLGSLLECSAGLSTLADENSEISQPFGSHGKCPATAPWKFFAHPCGVSPYMCAALYSARELRNCLCRFLESSSFLPGALPYTFHPLPVSLNYNPCLLNTSTLPCLAAPFLCHGLKCASRQKVGVIVRFISFVCDLLKITVLCCL